MYANSRTLSLVCLLTFYMTIPCPPPPLSLSPKVGDPDDTRATRNTGAPPPLVMSARARTSQPAQAPPLLFFCDGPASSFHSSRLPKTSRLFPGWRLHPPRPLPRAPSEHRRLVPLLGLFMRHTSHHNPSFITGRTSRTNSTWTCYIGGY